MIEIDNKIKYLIENSSNAFKRCMFVLTGNTAADNIPILMSVRNFDCDFEPKILWCFKNEDSHIKRSGKNNRKFEKSCKKMNIAESNFDNFVFSSNITWCHYNDSDNVLGMTFDACVLQDFESLTPNIMAKVIETVKGGGLIFFVLPKISKLSDIGAMSMDAHKRYRTFSYDDVDFRFNYRFFYSLMSHHSCLVLDKDMHVLPVNVEVLATLEPASSNILKKMDKKIAKMKKKESTEHGDIAPIIDMCATKDQTRALIDLIECFNENSDPKLNNEVQMKKRKVNSNLIEHLHKVSMLTAGRGRGKSALLGLSIAIAVHKGLTNICVTSPCLENVGTLMQFIVKGLISLGYNENEHFTKRTQALTNSKGYGVAEIEIVKNFHRQTVKYIEPTHDALFDKLDLLCIDETAAIPLPTVKRLLALKCSLVFMSSTIHGYEGTGRSLSLKLMKQIRESFSTNGNKDKFCEVTLKDPIRYSNDDDVEKWLNNLLCLDCGATVSENELCNVQPSLNDCQLFLVNRDVLFSGHPQSELILQRMMGIYVSSHYKNSPNDLQMLCDSSSHALFCIGKATLLTDGSPTICGIIQVAFEGSIDPLVAKNSIEKGLRPSGDMVPWSIIQQFNHYDFAKLSGARVVRIAVDPQFQRQGYGGHALKLLHEYFDRKVAPNCRVTEQWASMDKLVKEDLTSNPLTNITRLPALDKMGPLLLSLAERKHEQLDYLSVSFGLTSELLRFWKKNGFVPVYLRQTVNESTGEHSCIMIKAMTSSESVDGNPNWLQAYNNDFCRRLCNLLSGPFRRMDSILALELLQKKTKEVSKPDACRGDIDAFFTASDFVRIDKYLRNLIDYHAVIDLLFAFAMLHNTRRFEKVKLPKMQELVLVGMGLQHKVVDEVTADLTALQVLGSKAPSAAEVLGHLRECLKSLSKAMKHLLQ